MTFLRLLLAVIVLAGSSGLAADAFPPESPEHQALVAAGPDLGDETFTLREDYWKGLLTTQTGRALRLQFFKRNHYRLFLGVAPESLPPGAKLQIHVYDAENEEVASAVGEAGEASLGLTFENDRKTGLYLILLRIDVPPGPFPEKEVPAVLFYGWR